MVELRAVKARLLQAVQAREAQLVSLSTAGRVRPLTPAAQPPSSIVSRPVTCMPDMTLHRISLSVAGRRNSIQFNLLRDQRGILGSRMDTLY